MSDDAEQRAADAREAAASRLRKLAREEAREDRALMWDQLGFNVRTDGGLERLKRALNGFSDLGIDLDNPERAERAEGMIRWAFKSYERSETSSKRVLFWVSSSLGLGAAIIELLKSYLDWRAK